MRRPIVVGFSCLVAFSLLCVGCALAQHWLGGSLWFPRVVFLLGTFGLVLGFAYAGVLLVGPEPRTARVIDAVAFSLLGTVISWAFAVNVARMAAGLRGLPV